LATPTFMIALLEVAIKKQPIGPPQYPYKGAPLGLPLSNPRRTMPMVVKKTKPTMWFQNDKCSADVYIDKLPFNWRLSDTKTQATTAMTTYSTFTRPQGRGGQRTRSGSVSGRPYRG
jgi:hypothetical protein